MTKGLDMAGRMSRRAFVAGLPLFLAACQTSGGGSGSGVSARSTLAPVSPNYGAMQDGGWQLAAVNTATVNPIYLRQRVSNPTGERAGVIVVDTASKFLYLTEERGTAMRYGVGVGRDGFSWSGRAIVDRKQEWPKWHPPPEMMARDPEAAKWPEGMPGGITNPLGARALYLAQNGKDTYFRIHGTTQPKSIGQAMSSGCIRLFNQDIIDLYNRVPIGTEVVVTQTAVV